MHSCVPRTGGHGRRDSNAHSRKIRLHFAVSSLPSGSGNLQDVICCLRLRNAKLKKENGLLNRRVIYFSCNSVHCLPRPMAFFCKRRLGRSIRAPAERMSENFLSNGHF